jgi:hypothetical protein
MAGNPRLYQEPESEPITPQGGVARPWITWVKGLQQSAPLDLRSIIVGIFQRVFSMFFNGAGPGIPGGGIGGLFTGGLRVATSRPPLNDPNRRQDRVKEFRKVLASELHAAIQARNTGQLNHYLKERGFIVVPGVVRRPSSLSSPNGPGKGSQINHQIHTSMSSPSSKETSEEERTTQQTSRSRKSLDGDAPAASASFTRQDIEHEGERILLLIPSSKAGSRNHSRGSIMGRRRRSLSGNDVRAGEKSRSKQDDGFL